MALAKYIDILCKIAFLLRRSISSADSQPLISPFDDEVGIQGDAEVFVVDLWNVFDVDT